MQYSLRAATDADYHFLFHLNEVTMREYVVETFGSWDHDAEARRLRERLTSSKIRIVVVAGQDVGMLQVEATGTEVVLANIRVAPEYQGRGLGTSLVTEVLSEARQARLPVRLRVLKANPARKLYGRLGFSIVEETETHYVMRALSQNLSTTEDPGRVMSGEGLQPAP